MASFVGGFVLPLEKLFSSEDHLTTRGEAKGFASESKNNESGGSLHRRGMVGLCPVMVCHVGNTGLGVTLTARLSSGITQEGRERV